MNQKMKLTTNSWAGTMLRVLLIAILPMHVWTYKILMIPIPGKSHLFQMVAMAEGLVSRGHKVTFFIGEHYELKLPDVENGADMSVVTYRDVVDGEETVDYNAKEQEVIRLVMKSGNTDLNLGAVSKFIQDWCRQLTVENDDKLDKLEQEKFDLAVVDGFVASCPYLIPHRLHIPVISSAVSFDPLIVRVPWLPSFVPSIVFPLSDQMTFTERLKNTAGLFLLSFVIRPLYFPDMEPKVLDKFRRYGDFSSPEELMSKSAMWFLTQDSIVDYPRPMMPNMVEVGGLTIKRSTGKLPPGINQFIASAQKGVILMTFGSTAATIPAHMVEKFSSTFQRLDGYRVIWKVNNEHNVKLPDNVMISQWLPQNDLLAHPSVKLFITHCGNNGQYEAVYHAVPMIGFPVSGDHPYIAKRLDQKGYGLSMDLHDFTADELLENIHKILEDKSYKERVTKASEIFRSRVQSPVERATFWIEHVCQFGGDHLRSAGNELTLYSYLMLDVLAFILVAVHIIIYLLYRLLRLTASKCRKRAESNIDMSKKIS